jgi:hypothetical protein
MIPPRYLLLKHERCHPWGPGESHRIYWTLFDTATHVTVADTPPVPDLEEWAMARIEEWEGKR